MIPTSTPYSSPPRPATSSRNRLYPVLLLTTAVLLSAIVDAMVPPSNGFQNATLAQTHDHPSYASRVRLTHLRQGVASQSRSPLSAASTPFPWPSGCG